MYIFLKIYFLFYAYVCGPKCMSLHHTHAGTHGRFPGTVVIGDCEAPDVSPRQESSLAL